MPAKVLFWLVRSAPQIHVHDFDMIEAACRLGMIKETSAGYQLSPETQPYLDPNSSLYMGLWIRNYERIASRMFSKGPLLEALKTGKTQRQFTFGAKVSNPFDLKEMDLNLFRDLMEGMHQANIREGPSFTQCLDLKPIRRTLDIGGALQLGPLHLRSQRPGLIRYRFTRCPKQFHFSPSFIEGTQPTTNIQSHGFPGISFKSPR